MKPSLGYQSLLWFLASLIILVLLTSFEGSLTGLSLATERLLTVILLIVPGLIGATLGAVGFKRRTKPLWAAFLGLVLNGLFVIFHLLLLSFVG